MLSQKLPIRIAILRKSCVIPFWHMCWIEYTKCRKEWKCRESIINALFQRTVILRQEISEKLFVSVRERVSSACLSLPFAERSLWNSVIGASVCEILFRSSIHFSSAGWMCAKETFPCCNVQLSLLRIGSV